LGTKITLVVHRIQLVELEATKAKVVEAIEVLLLHEVVDCLQVTLVVHLIMIVKLPLDRLQHGRFLLLPVITLLRLLAALLVLFLHLVWTLIVHLGCEAFLRVLLDDGHHFLKSLWLLWDALSCLLSHQNFLLLVE
jgi:hypothetical protein